MRPNPRRTKAEVARAQATRKCEDCEVKVASRAAGHAASRGGASGPLGQLAPPKPRRPPNLHSISCKRGTYVLRGSGHSSYRRRQASGCRRRGSCGGALAARRRTRGR